MIRIKVELLSAINGETTELARMDISNLDNHPTPSMGNYLGTSYRGRSKAQLDRCTVMKTGTVMNWPRQHLHVWNLVAKMLRELGYTEWR